MVKGFVVGDGAMVITSIKDLAQDNKYIDISLEIILECGGDYVVRR